MARTVSWAWASLPPSFFTCRWILSHDRINGCTIFSDHLEVSITQTEYNNAVIYTFYHCICPAFHSFHFCSAYLHNHVEVCSEYRLSVPDWQLQVSWFFPLIGRLCDPASRLLVHLPLLPGACGEVVDPWQLHLCTRPNWWLMRRSIGGVFQLQSVHQWLYSIKPLGVKPSN